MLRLLLKIIVITLPAAGIIVQVTGEVNLLESSSVSGRGSCNISPLNATSRHHLQKNPSLPKKNISSEVTSSVKWTTHRKKRLNDKGTGKAGHSSKTPYIDHAQNLLGNDEWSETRRKMSRERHIYLGPPLHPFIFKESRVVVPNSGTGLILMPDSQQDVKNATADHSISNRTATTAMATVSKLFTKITKHFFLSPASFPLRPDQDHEFGEKS